ncbi:SDR family oxidoreductase [Pseudonocardia sp. KRD-184]|uniref:SDR family oxidoreductase n=1 Tax=Pseudonocardia oceani TaxID=2792013 RepID=A0ABS6U4A6_9PSEU|nr:SDR family NAD(P)-dependent oxidoreductase [Pseudonocardia oceani]MBW0089864.1 SDR family oxidoreductase [Pseudonocardia oceani]MBW0097444.1 SDR family oxidoreductase [Pseudonocardia oceani]MBW0123776.1 SDR family oxidoreductase [Pseudonocardia oceani]MBW0127059.1 SDR family oxidoreductase [Pseudonocardia oceani]
MQLIGKRIVVVGASRGIGAAVLRAFVREGARVVAMDVAAADDEQVTPSSGPGEVHFVRCDVTDRESVTTAFATAGEELGGLDVLVHTPGVDLIAAAHEIDDELWDRTMNVNVRGTMLTNQAAYHAMRGTGGAIVNFGSDSGIHPSLRSAAYSTSKAAVHNWTRAVAMEWGPLGIRVNAVLPVVWTPLARERLAQMSDADRTEYLESVRRRIPLGGEPGDADLDIAPVVVFLASDSARYMTGQLVPVNGGYGMVR